MRKLQVGDKVQIIAGKDKGREGKVEKVFPKKGLVLVPEVNIYKKHVKGSPGTKAGIYEIPRPLPFAKLMLVCPACKKPTKVGFKKIKNEKIRVCKKCKKEINKNE